MKGRHNRGIGMDTECIVAAILAAAQTADGHNRADSYITNYRIILAELRQGEGQPRAPILDAADAPGGPAE